MDPIPAFRANCLPIAGAVPTQALAALQVASLDAKTDGRHAELGAPDDEMDLGSGPRALLRTTAQIPLLESHCEPRIGDLLIRRNNTRLRWPSGGFYRSNMRRLLGWDGAQLAIRPTGGNDKDRIP